MDNVDFSPLDTSAKHQSVTLRQMGVHGQNQLKHLHALLDKHILTIKKKKMLENNQDTTAMGTKE